MNSGEYDTSFDVCIPLGGAEPDAMREWDGFDCGCQHTIGHDNRLRAITCGEHGYDALRDRAVDDLTEHENMICYWDGRRRLVEL